MPEIIAIANSRAASWWDVFEDAELIASFYGPDAQKNAQAFATSLSVQRQSEERGFGQATGG